MSLGTYRESSIKWGGGVSTPFFFGGGGGLT